jgi:hypothetical protein
VKVGLVFVSATDSYCDLLKKIWIDGAVLRAKLTVESRKRV